MYVALATVPYPEVLFTGFTFLAFTFLDNPLKARSFYLAVLFLNLACLTRYEGWLLAGMLVCEEIFWHLKTKGLSKLTPLVGKLFLYILSPLAWIIFVVTEPGGLQGRLDGILNFTTGLTSVTLTNRFFTRLNFDYIISFANNFYHLLSWQVGNGIMVFGAIGLIVAFKSATKRSSQIRIFVFLILDLFLVAFWSPWNFTNLRQPFVWEVFLIFYAAYGLEQLAKFVFKIISALSKQINVPFQMNQVVSIFAIFLLALYIPSTIKFVDQTSHETHFLIPAENGLWLNSRLSTDDSVLVLSDDPFQVYALATYISLP